MPLSPSASREHIHTRRLECTGYRREDGLWDVEGHLTDTKTYDFDSQFRGTVASGEPVHDMWVRITVDDQLVIQNIEAVTDASPFPICPAITANFARLKGISLRPGFFNRIKEILGGIEGCTHLVEMLGPVATTAYQTILPYRDRMRRLRGEDPRPPDVKPRFLDSCHGWSSKEAVVKQLFPRFYTGAS
jgi:hypothetical protein